MHWSLFVGVVCTDHTCIHIIKWHAKLRPQICIHPHIETSHYIYTYRVVQGSGRAFHEAQFPQFASDFVVGEMRLYLDVLVGQHVLDDFHVCKFRGDIGFNEDAAHFIGWRETLVIDGGKRKKWKGKEK